MRVYALLSSGIGYAASMFGSRLPVMRDGAPTHGEAAGGELRRRRRSRGPQPGWRARWLRALRRLARWRRLPTEAFFGASPGPLTPSASARPGPIAWWRRRAREATRLADLGEQFEDVLDEVWRAEREWKLDQRLDFATRHRPRH